MCVIGVTGPRILTPDQRFVARGDLIRIMSTGAAVTLHVGDANGLDKLAWTIGLACSPVLYTKNPQLPHRAQGAERSTRMVRALAQAGGTLYAFANKPAPAELWPSRSWPKGAEGSGTWGTVAIAVGNGVPVTLIWLVNGIVAPEWLNTRQLVL